MRILFILEHYYPYTGGAETLFKYVAENLAEKGHNVTVITTRFKKDLKKTETLNKVKIKRLHFYNRYIFTFFSLPFLLKEAKKADIIHTTTYNAALPAFLAAKITKTPIYITFHEIWGNLWFKLPFIPKLLAFGNYCFEQLIIKLPFNKYISVSDFTQNKLIENGISKKKIKIGFIRKWVVIFETIKSS